MIKIENNRVTMSGTGILLRAELGICICSMLEKKDINRRELGQLSSTFKRISQ